MPTLRAARLLAVAALAVAPATAIARSAAKRTKSPAAPHAGTWTMEPSKYSVLVSGSLTVKGHSVTHLQATITQSDELCPAGVLELSKSAPAIVEANLGHGHYEWEVASGGSAVGGGALQPTPIGLTVGGRSEVNATMTVVFPSKGVAASGYIAWGDDGTGAQVCDLTFTVKQG